MPIFVPRSKGNINQDNNCDMNRLMLYNYKHRLLITLIVGYVAKVRLG